MLHTVKQIMAARLWDGSTIIRASLADADSWCLAQLDTVIMILNFQYLKVP